MWHLILALLLAAPADAGNYVVVCTAPCVAGDGTTQPAGTVLNRILAAPGFVPGAGLALAPDTGQAIYSAVVAPAVPQSVSMAQARAALSRAGLLAAADAAAAALGSEAAIAWQFSTTIGRASPALAAVQARLGLSDAQVDALFVAAAAIAF